MAPVFDDQLRKTMGPGETGDTNQNHRPAVFGGDVGKRSGVRRPVRCCKTFSMLAGWHELHIRVLVLNSITSRRLNPSIHLLLRSLRRDTRHDHFIHGDNSYISETPRLACTVLYLWHGGREGWTSLCQRDQCQKVRFVARFESMTTISARAMEMMVLSRPWVRHHGTKFAPLQHRSCLFLPHQLQITTAGDVSKIEPPIVHKCPRANSRSPT